MSTELVPPVRPSLLIAFGSFHCGERLRLKVTSIVCLLLMLLQLSEHLSHLLGRHVEQSSESLNPRVSVSIHLWSRPQ